MSGWLIENGRSPTLGMLLALLAATIHTPPSVVRSGRARRGHHTLSLAAPQLGDGSWRVPCHLQSPPSDCGDVHREIDDNSTSRAHDNSTDAGTAGLTRGSDVGKGATAGSTANATDGPGGCGNGVDMRFAHPQPIAAAAPTLRDMAGEELKRQRTAWHAKALKRVLKPDWRSGQGGFTCDLFRCDRCGESQTRLHRTIRAGKRVPDEASTLYATCIACNARWEVDR